MSETVDELRAENKDLRRQLDVTERHFAHALRRETSLPSSLFVLIALAVGLMLGLMVQTLYLAYAVSTKDCITFCEAVDESPAAGAVED